MSFTLLQAAQDWTAYQAAVLKNNNLSGMAVSWGSGPAEFPCLAETAIVPTVNGLRLMSAYVYVANAMTLLRAAGKAVTETQQQAQPMGQGIVDPPAPRIDVGRALHRFQHDQVRFNHVITAQNMALIHFIRETLCVSDEAFEEKYNESLSLVDEAATIQREEKLAALKEQGRLTEARLLERSLPEEDPKPGC